MKTFTVAEINEKRILGRNTFTDDKALSLFWAASALEVNVKSAEVWAFISCDYNGLTPWVSVSINGYPVSRFIPSKEGQWYCVAQNLNPEVEHLVTIMKDTQPMPGDEKNALFIHQLKLSDSGTFCELKPRKYNIEVIGDSISTGEGLNGNPDEMDWISMWMSAHKTYAVQFAKAMDGNLSVISQCGWGLKWAYDGNFNNNIPDYYNEVCSLYTDDFHKKLGACDKWDFSKTKNDFVIINLGTNDNSGLSVLEDKDGAKKLFVQTVESFLGTVRKSNPSAQIIWMYGMLKLDQIPALLEKGISNYKNSSGDTKVHLLEVAAMEDVEQIPEDKGSRGHPGPKTHRLAAESLLNLAKRISDN